MSYALGSLALVLAACLGCSLYVHFRGRARRPLRRHLASFHTALAPYNALVYWQSAAPNRPFQSSDPRLFPELEGLRRSWTVLRDEGLAVLREGGGGSEPSDAVHDEVMSPFYEEGWERFYLRWYGDFLPSARGTCPRTIELLAAAPSVRGAMFALLPPGGRLFFHRDPYAGSLRYHVGLSTPNSDACFLDVDGERASWRDGEDFLFDSTYLHHAANETDTPRLVLMCDVERPLRSRSLTAVNRWVANTVMVGLATPNRSGDPTGYVLRLLARVAPLRRWITSARADAAR